MSDNPRAEPKDEEEIPWAMLEAGALALSNVLPDECSMTQARSYAEIILRAALPGADQK
jgi:hypothetical protein